MDLDLHPLQVYLVNHSIPLNLTNMDLDYIVSVL